jgi:N utilization substance protein B
MANRHLLRTIVMQSLYESEFHPDQPIAEIAERYTRSAGAGDDATGYVEAALAGIAKHRKRIDELITTNAPEWPLDQIAGIDRAVLRLGIYEILESSEIPPKVAINEAVELAKSFGGENSGSFVNGVLGTVYRASDKYDPKDDVTEKPDEPTPPEEKTD